MKTFAFFLIYIYVYIPAEKKQD